MKNTFARFQLQYETHQHICSMQVVFAGHGCFQFLRNLFDVLDLVQEAKDVFVLDALDPELPQFISLTMKEHLTGQQVLLNLSPQTHIRKSWRFTLIKTGISLVVFFSQLLVLSIIIFMCVGSRGEEAKQTFHRRLKPERAVQLVANLQGHYFKHWRLV